MNIFSGIYYRQRDNADPEFFKKLKFGPGRLNKAWQQYTIANVAFGAPGDITQILFIDEATGLVIAGNCIIHEDGNAIHGIAALKNILQLYKTKGDKCINDLVGEFSFIIYNAKDLVLFCARDHMGFRPFFYYIDEHYFIFSNDISVLSSFSFSKELDHEWLISYFEALPNTERNLFKNIKAILPASYACVDRNNASFERYWAIEELTSVRTGSYQDALDGFRYHISNAVSSRLAATTKPAIELSGGIDSITVAILAANNLKDSGKALSAFTNALPERGKNRFKNFTDEWDTAGFIAKQYGIKRHFKIIESRANPLEVADQVNDMIGYPAYGAALLQSNLFHKASCEETDVLLTGFGGNELVSEYAVRSYMNDLLKRNELIKLGKYLYKHNNSLLRSAAITTKEYLSFIAKMDKKFWENKTSSDWGMLLFKKNILNDVDIKSKFFSNVYPPNIGLREKNIYRINSGKTSIRINACYLVNAHLGINYTHPLLHKPLMEFYFTLPDEYKAANKLGRGIFRDAMQHIVPKEIINQPKATNSATIPYVKVEVEEHYNELMGACLSIADNAFVFDYVDKAKLALKTDVPDTYVYRFLKFTVMLHSFLEKHKNQVFNELC